MAAQIGGHNEGEKTLAGRLYPRLRGDELLTADRGFYSWQAWQAAQRSGAPLLWRAPTNLELPVVKVLPDGTYLSVVIDPAIRFVPTPPVGGVVVAGRQGCRGDLPDGRCPCDR